MRDLYRPDGPEQKIKLKGLENMSKEEVRDAYRGLCEASRAYIHQTTKKFLKHFNKKDRFQMAVKQGIVNTLPHEYNELLLKRIDRLCSMAESKGYVINFSKWRTTKEYGWFFVREK